MQDDNPPKTVIEFFKDQKNLDKINCFSDEGSGWDKSKTRLIENISLYCLVLFIIFYPQNNKCYSPLKPKVSWRFKRVRLEFTILGRVLL